MWAHDYPFKKIREKMLGMRPGQKVNKFISMIIIMMVMITIMMMMMMQVNKFPGSGFITNKVNLATSGLKNVPQVMMMMMMMIIIMMSV